VGGRCQASPDGGFPDAGADAQDGNTPDGNLQDGADLPIDGGDRPETGLDAGADPGGAGGGCGCGTSRLDSGTWLLGLLVALAGWYRRRP
jgi:MYXO-CTERM domain-containing protein